MIQDNFHMPMSPFSPESSEGLSKSNYYEERKAKEYEALRAMSEVLGLTIVREDKLNGTHAIVVDNGDGEEVYIGFPDGMRSANGTMTRKPAATGKIYTPRIRMSPYGHGIWRFGIDI